MSLAPRRGNNDTRVMHPLIPPALIFGLVSFTMVFRLRSTISKLQQRVDRLEKTLRHLERKSD